ncbi:30S ribosomal protein S9 [Candidatus Falkowbacteria bacterium]|jgi:small subunit ribosomal protein S9|nr:30S ribosomal protein S9 [Candidatus Falkowbacteria bacterium]MBT4433556.1 30S ribosomal protein S9 [Candidatus Falkowbacteria bacterium]
MSEEKTIKKEETTTEEEVIKDEKKEQVEETAEKDDTEESKEGAIKKNKKEYIYAVGRRKSASAQVRLYKKGEGEIEVNKKDIKEYFPTTDVQDIILSPLKVVGQGDKLKIWAKVAGGGKIGQAEAIRHGISRALLEINPNFRKPLRKQGFLTRDSRIKERKKPGLKRARRAPQWSKR